MQRRWSELERTRAVLKETFVGIDGPIDSVMDAVTTWYLAPEAMERPTVVNLWGLTGTGKTALLERLVRELGLTGCCRRFSMASDDALQSLEIRIAEIHSYHNGEPQVIVLDEFQRARLLDAERHEVRADRGAILWDLLDSGRLQIQPGLMDYRDELRNLKRNVRECIRRGVRVVEGRVVHGVEAFREVFRLPANGSENSAPPLFLSENDQEWLARVGNRPASDPGAFSRQIRTLDERGVMDLVERLVMVAKEPVIADCSRSLIFIVGNLDEAYTMAADMSPESDPDEFHRQSLGITVPHIKSALQWRFTSEQIARLGNTHVVYPALSSAALREIISRVVRASASRIGERFGVTVEVDPSVFELVYREGVYPGQGVRPILTTVSHVVDALLVKMLAAQLLRAERATSVRLSFSEQCLRLEPRSGLIALEPASAEVRSQIERLRKPRADDFQALCAVHEAGHAVVAIALLGVVPRTIRSATADPERRAFSHAPVNYDRYSRAGALDRIAVNLGGHAAERLVFGWDQVSNGSSADIDRATHLALSMVKSLGLGSIAAYAQREDRACFNYALRDVDGSLDDEGEAILREAAHRAESTLRRYEPLLLSLARYLSDHSRIDHDAILAEVRRSIPGFEERDAASDGTFPDYRRLLWDRGTPHLTAESADGANGRYTPSSETEVQRVES